MIGLILIIQLSLGYLGEVCISYSCSNSTTTQCIFNISSSTYAVSQCNSSLHCEIPASGQTGYCMPNVNQTLLPYPGEPCSTSCRYGNCTGGVCVGVKNGIGCNKTQECDVGLSCRKGICLPLISANSDGCSSDYDCVNSAGCSSINLNYSGTCLNYFSIAKYSTIKTCYNNKNLLCQSGICGIYGSGFICLAELKNSLNSPYNCNMNDYCYSEADPFTGISLTSKCNCGLNGTGICGLFPGDPETTDYKTNSRAWVRTQQILSCHTVRRFDPECISKLWDNKKYSYLYNLDYVRLYQRVYGAASCLVSVFYPLYSSDLVSYMSDSLMISILTLAFIS